MTTITGFFHDQKHVDLAVDALMAKHFSAPDISISVATSKGVRRTPLKQKTRATRDGVICGIIGAALGGIGAFLLATGVIDGSMILHVPEEPIRAAALGVFYGGGLGLAIGILAGLDRWREEADIKQVAQPGDPVRVEVAASRDRVEAARQALLAGGADHLTVKDD